MCQQELKLIYTKLRMTKRKHSLSLSKKKKAAHLRHFFFSLNAIKQIQKHPLATECSVEMISNSMAQDPAEGAAYCNHMLIN